eukprot:COSAG01_NODE_2301_length_7953_cov_4.000127_6_plen_123_part_00
MHTLAVTPHIEAPWSRFPSSSPVLLGPPRFNVRGSCAALCRGSLPDLPGGVWGSPSRVRLAYFMIRTEEAAEIHLRFIFDLYDDTHRRGWGPTVAGVPRVLPLVVVWHRSHAGWFLRSVEAR